MTDTGNISIEVRDCAKHYRGSQEDALKNVNLTVMSGELFGLLGPNAAGKTTLISIMCGLLGLSHGSVKVFGFDVGKKSRSIRPLIGLIPQDLALYPTLTVRENIRFFGQMHGIFGKELKQRIPECLSLLKLEGHADKRISACSGGIKRRTNLVAGLIHRPRLVFLDEPTVGVDAQSRNLIFEYIRELNSSGTTVMYTTHYMEEAQNLCSRVVIMDNGSLVCEGSPRDLIRNEGCSDLGEVFLKLTGRQLRD